MGIDGGCLNPEKYADEFQMLYFLKVYRWYVCMCCSVFGDKIALRDNMHAS